MDDHPVIMGQVGAEVTDIRSGPCLGPLEWAVSLPPPTLSSLQLQPLERCRQVHIPAPGPLLLPHRPSSPPLRSCRSLF